jgi:hypothetical protein
MTCFCGSNPVNQKWLASQGTVAACWNVVKINGGDEKKSVFVLISYVTKLFVLSKKGQIACCIMVLSKTDIIVYVICGQHSLFHRWRTSPETCQEVQIKAWNPTCIAKGPKQIAWSRVVKYLTRTSPHHPTLGWRPRTIFGWCLNPHKMGQCPMKLLNQLTHPKWHLR